MFSRSAQVLAALSLLELVVLALVATRVDVLLLILVVVALSGFGLFFFFRQTAGLIRHSVEEVANAEQGVAPELGDRSLKVAGAALLVFPGLLSGLIGGLLMVPPVRAAVRPLIGARVSRRMPTDFSAPGADFNQIFRRRDVVDVSAVDVTAVRRDPRGSSEDPSAPPELN